LREYWYPDGRLAAREHVLYDSGGLKSYELEALQTSSVGRVTAGQSPAEPGRTQLSFEYNKDLARTSHARIAHESLSSSPLVNDMIGFFICEHFDKLNHGLKVNCRYIVVSRKETVGLSFTKEGETTYHGKPVILLKLQPTSPLISVLVDPLHFTVEKEPPHRVLQYVGRTTPKINEGGHWKDLDAVTVFEW